MNRSNGSFAKIPSSFRCSYSSPDAAVLRDEEKVADQPSRLKSLGTTVRRVNGGQAYVISGDKVVVTEGEEI